MCFALAFTSSLTVNAAADTHWTAVRSASLTVLGDQSAKKLREVAVELEQFRSVLGRLSARGRPAPTAPTMVYVFGTRKTFEQFLPLRNGKPVQLGGYFQRGADTNAIALSTEGFSESAPVIYHEYTHLLLGNAMRAVPVWLNEGLAEYYSTYRLRPDGKGADIGHAIARHLALLRERFIPLTELLAVNYSSDLYNEGDRRSIFYAESWALTHFLMTELPSGQDLINQFAGTIAGGARPDQAFASTFGMTPAAFEPKLKVVRPPAHVQVVGLHVQRAPGIGRRVAGACCPGGRGRRLAGRSAAPDSAERTRRPNGSRLRPESRPTTPRSNWCSRACAPRSRGTPTHATR